MLSSPSCLLVINNLLHRKPRPLVKGLSSRVGSGHDPQENVDSVSCLAFGEVMLHTIGYIYTRNISRELRKDTQYMKVPVLVDWVQDIDPSQLMAAKGASAYIHMLEELRDKKEQTKTL
ncbi:chaperone protein dnaJ 10-like [Trifolium pratense]|uniref:Chaperone protein dnaJ 10-like n=1 Tax=Trifolium pratense TaxID=57577 RepID=A0A2K3P892_TRIPR|nr:chaperone protein dnaJ 10-like [Trifolium pratense]